MRKFSNPLSALIPKIPHSLFLNIKVQDRLSWDLGSGPLSLFWRGRVQPSPPFPPAGPLQATLLPDVEACMPQRLNKRTKPPPPRAKTVMVVGVNRHSFHKPLLCPHGRPCAYWTHGT